jgi:hypothetical protein
MMHAPQSPHQKFFVKKIQIDNTQVLPLSPEPNSNRAHCFLVYYDGGMASAAALKSAMDLSLPNTVIVAEACVPGPQLQARGEPRRRLQSSAEAVLAGAVLHAARRGISIRTETIECQDSGRALVQCAEDYRADIIFWGIERTEAERGLNRAAEYVLKFAPSKVVLVGV